MYEQATFADNLKKIISQRGTTQRRIAEELGVPDDHGSMDAAAVSALKSTANQWLRSP